METSVVVAVLVAILFSPVSPKTTASRVGTVSIATSYAPEAVVGDGGMDYVGIG